MQSLDEPKERLTDEETEAGKAKLAELMESLDVKTVTDINSKRRLYSANTGN